MCFVLFSLQEVNKVALSGKKERGRIADSFFNSKVADFGFAACCFTKIAPNNNLMVKTT